MRLLHLLLPSLDPAASAAFYRDVLELPVDGQRVRAGWSTIDLVPANGAVGCLHLAFNVPPPRFAAAAEWLAARVPLLRDPLGQARFRLEGAWQSESVYFAGPDGAVLELIARRALGEGARRDGPFNGAEIQCLSEVGLPSADVAAVTRSLGNHFDARPLGGEASDEFAPLGDHLGMLIVVERRRRWFPERRQLPWAQGLRLTVSGRQPGLRLRDAEGWELVAA
ncbi:hypothetical protein P6166_00515 [Stenotrophomonas sp. HITSZ_GD]|uniref:VOC family protein n=1 Tax=Stenotrophomonas sp. HITSZ_GD TaxID=3037248 RepID=UPI00240DB4C9|nr:hypothetical protein [Stenotrophomonas sp. HITSZ_GD]MDG2523843.1 hypothetical protein [Stenotrophomonas sp. HITSZ_GD]